MDCDDFARGTICFGVDGGVVAFRFSFCCSRLLSCRLLTCSLRGIPGRPLPKPVVLAGEVVVVVVVVVVVLLVDRDGLPSFLSMFERLKMPQVKRRKKIFNYFFKSTTSGR